MMHHRGRSAQAKRMRDAKAPTPKQRSKERAYNSEPLPPANWGTMTEVERDAWRKNAAAWQPKDFRSGG